MHPTGKSHFPFLAGRPAIVLALIAGFLVRALLPASAPGQTVSWVPGALAIVLVLLLLVEVGAAWRRRQYLRIQANVREELRTANTRLAMRIVELTRRREEDRLLESAVIHAHDAIVVLEPDPLPGSGRRVLYVNEAFCRMTGYSRDDIVGRSLYLLRGPLTEPDVLGEIGESLDSGKPFQGELQNHRKDGSTYWVWIHLVPVPNDQGGIAHWVMIQRDVTDRKAIETALRESEEKLRLVGDNLPNGAIFQIEAGADNSHRFTYVSAGMEAVVGVSREQILADARAAYEAIQPEERVTVAEAVAEAAGRAAPFDREIQISTPEGGVKWVHVRAMPDSLHSGTCVWNGILMDVTARRRLEEQLHEAQKLEAVGMLAGAVAHEFNNLLTAVLGNLALVQLATEDPRRTHVRAAEAAAERATELTQKLLACARRNQLVTGPVAPRAALDGVVESIRRDLDPRIDLEVEIAPECRSILADAGLLHRALVGICKNACDAMPDGGTLTLSAEPAASLPDPLGEPTHNVPGVRYVRLGVTDTGVGMCDEVKARAFDPFFTTKGNGNGVGLGLAMVRGIVKQHQGYVDCITSPGAGTRIDLYLPSSECTAACPETTPSDAGLMPTPEDPPLEPSAFPVTRRVATPDSLILLVDDESMIRDLGKAVLEREGYSVLTACDGLEAIEIFERDSDRIGLVVLDVTMPRMSGRETYHRLIKIDTDARILFSTGYSVDEIAELDSSLGLLNKPYRPDDLVRAVRDGLSTVPVES